MSFILIKISKFQKLLFINSKFIVMNDILDYQLFD